MQSPVDAKEPAQHLEPGKSGDRQFPLITAWHLELPGLCQHLINTILHALPLSPTRPLMPAGVVCHRTQSAFRPAHDAFMTCFLFKVVNAA